MKKLIAVLFVLALTSACTVQRPVSNDYGQYLRNNVGTSGFPKAKKPAAYQMSQALQNHRYEFRSFMTGAANLWIVEFGKMLDATLRSKDVQDAFNNHLSPLDNTNADDYLLYFDLKNFVFKDAQATVDLKVTLKEKDKVIFEKDYTATGNSQGGKMFWGGAFAQKNAVQQSTKVALDEIFTQLITDFNSAL